MPPPFVMGGGHIASPLSVRTYVHMYVHPVRTKKGFRVISFEYIGALDSYFIHRYIIIKYRSSLITNKIHQLLSELWPLISIWKNGFRAISFENSNVLDSYFIHRFIIIKYRSSLMTDKIHRLLSELWPLISVWKMFSWRYLLNTLVNWIHISHTGI